LTEAGYVDHAYRLLMQTECPSWLYPVTMGATTIWERWDSMLPDGRVNPDQMTSFNHYALGAVAEWLHRTVGGLAPAQPGYRTIDIRPRPGGGLTHALARHRTPYGIAESSWTLDADRFDLVVTVPQGTTARIVLPFGETSPVTVGPGRVQLSCATG
jgi:alpha-L-rhamnosidase